MLSPMSITIKERPCWFKPEEFHSGWFGPGQRVRKVSCFQSKSTNLYGDSPDLIVTGKLTESYHGLAINRYRKEISRAAVNLPDRIIGRKVTFIYRYNEPVHLNLSPENGQSK